MQKVYFVNCRVCSDVHVEGGEILIHDFGFICDVCRQDITGCGFAPESLKIQLRRLAYRHEVHQLYVSTDELKFLVEHTRHVQVQRYGAEINKSYGL